MATNKQRLNRKRLAIKKEFDRLYKEEGLRREKIYEKLDEKFFMGESAISKIMSMSLEEEEEVKVDPRQLSILDQI